jgi:hypothetical protein
MMFLLFAGWPFWLSTMIALQQIIVAMATSHFGSEASR